MKMRPHKQRIKPYVIHILAVPALTRDVFDLPPENTAVILCTDRTNRYIRELPEENTLTVSFPDMENRNYPGAFNENHARRIITFLESLSDDVSDVYICCSQGISRSPAVAAALLRSSGRSDAPVWENPFYTPNALVYFRLCRESGVFITRFSVWKRTVCNRKACRKVQKNGGSVKHERWEVIE